METPPVCAAFTKIEAMSVSYTGFTLPARLLAADPGQGRQFGPEDLGKTVVRGDAAPVDQELRWPDEGNRVRRLVEQVDRGVVTSHGRAVHDGLTLGARKLDHGRRGRLCARVRTVRVTERDVRVIRPQIDGNLVREGPARVRCQPVETHDDFADVVVRLGRGTLTLNADAEGEDRGARRHADVHFRLGQVDNRAVSATDDRGRKRADLDHVAAPLEDEALQP